MRLARSVIKTSCVVSLHVPWCVAENGEQNGNVKEFEFSNPINECVYHVSSIPIVRADKTRSTMFILQDITARKCAEIERENLISELEMKNTELEQFTHTVSHDLKSPLITIKSFLGLLKEDIHLNKRDEIDEDCEIYPRCRQYYAASFR